MVEAMLKTNDNILSMGGLENCKLDIGEDKPLALIQSQLVNLADQIDRVSNLSERLEEKIKPVLYPKDKSTCDSPSDMVSIEVPLANTIAIMSCRVSDLADKLNNMLNRIEL